MNDVIEIDPRKTNQRGPRRWRGVAPRRVTLAEDQAAFDRLLGRLESECKPKNVQQEGDILALAQLRWRMERLDMVQNQSLNFLLLQSKTPPGLLTNEERLTYAYRIAAEDDSFLEIQRQHLAVIKTMHVVGTRVERWNPVAKPARGKG